MELFNKYESKYYNIVEELINENKSYTLSEVMEIISKHIKDNKFDQSFLNELIYKKSTGNISKEENFGGIFIEDDNKKNKFNPGIEGKIPIMLNNIEKQAVYSLIKSEKAASFLEESTINKIKDLYKNDDIEIWNEENIKIKNQAINGDKINSKKSRQNDERYYICYRK